MRVLCLNLVLLFSALFSSSFAIILMRKREREKAGCFSLAVFLMYCDNMCSMALPHSAVCDCGIT